MNYLGKALVLVNLLLSLFFLSWAAAVYTQSVDWGWKDPRKHVTGDFLAPEIDKRTALIKQVLPVIERADKQVDIDQVGDKTRYGLVAYEAILVQNHRWYNAMLAQLESGPGKIEIKHLNVDKNGVVLDPRSFLPVLGKQVTFVGADGKAIPVDRSYAGYQAELKTVRDKNAAVLAGIRQWVEKEKDLTARLNGTQDEAGKVVRPGLYTLLSHENAVQEQIKKEVAYLRPRWVQELVDAQLLLERQDSLRSRLAELRAVLSARR